MPADVRPRSRAWRTTALCTAVVCAGALLAWLWHLRVPDAETVHVGAASVQTVVGPTAPARAGPAYPLPTRGELQRLKDHVQRLLDKAQAGDATAMRELADIADTCFMLTLDRIPLENVLLQSEHRLAIHQGAAVAAVYRSASERQRVRCNALPRSGTGTRGLREAWRSKAAAAGELTARIQVFRTAEQGRPADVAAFLDEALASDDPRALLELVPLLWTATDPAMGVGNGDLPGYEGHDFMGQTPNALSLIACEQGLDCSVGSPLMDMACVGGALCGVQMDLPAHIISGADATGTREELDAALARMHALLATSASSR